MAGITIEIDIETARLLEARAKDRGVSLDAYLRHIAGEGQPIAPTMTAPNGDSTKDFDAALDELFADDARKLPATSTKYDRSDIYDDHD